MFARIAGSLAGEWTLSEALSEGPSGQQPPNSALWGEHHTLLAVRGRLQCPPFQAPSSAAGGAGGGARGRRPRHRAALVCGAAVPANAAGVGGHAQREPSCRHHHQRRRKSRAPGGCAAGALDGARSPAVPAAAAHAAAAAGGAQQPMQPQQPQPAVDGQQLASCIQAASSCSQLEAVVNTFLHNPSFGCSHAALVLSRLHSLPPAHGRHGSGRGGGGHLLLVELLARKLASTLAAAEAAAAAMGGAGAWRRQQQQQRQQQVLQQDAVAAVMWSFARSGYQPDATLVRRLLDQFWGCQPQQAEQQQQQQPVVDSDALATLAAGLAAQGLCDPAVWGRVRAAAAAAMPGMRSAALQHLAWSLATSQQSDGATTAALAAEVATRVRLRELDGEALAQVVWCLHVLGHRDEALLDAAAQRMAEEAAARRPAAQGGAGCRPPRQHLREPLGREPGSPREPLGQRAAALCSAAASRAYSALGRYDPLLCTLLLSRDCLHPAQA